MLFRSFGGSTSYSINFEPYFLSTVYTPSGIKLPKNKVHFYYGFTRTTTEVIGSAGPKIIKEELVDARHRIYQRTNMYPANNGSLGTLQGPVETVYSAVYEVGLLPTVAAQLSVKRPDGPTFSSLTIRKFLQGDFSGFPNYNATDGEFGTWVQYLPPNLSLPGYSQIGDYPFGPPSY